MILWTHEHIITLLPAMILMVGFSVLLGWLLRNSTRQVRMIPVQIITVLLLLLEVGKQALSFQRGYDLYHIPLHFCSLFIFVMPVFSFYRGKYRAAVETITAALCTSVFVLMAIYPALIYTDQNVHDFFGDFFSFHTVVFHNLVVLLCMLIFCLGLYEPRRQDRRVVSLFIVIYGVVAATAAQLLKTNFNNFYSCNIPPLESLRLLVQGALGYWPAQIMYILIVIVMDVGFVLLSLWLAGLACRLRKKVAA